MDTAFCRAETVDETGRMDPVGGIERDVGPRRCGGLEGEPVGGTGGVEYGIEPDADGGGVDADVVGRRVDQCGVL